MAEIPKVKRDTAAGPQPGVYALLLRLPRAITATVRRQSLPLAPGWYVYIGSAMGGLAARLARHLRTSQPRHWHLDHLLAAGKVLDIQAHFTTDPEAECRLAALVGRWHGATAVPDFGCSDCACSTHLYAFTTRPCESLHGPDVVAALPELYRELRKLYENHALWDRDPFETLIKCVLSLRTQDPVTDAAALRLFAVMRTPQAFATADPEAIAKLIFPVGMYRRKAVTLIEIARELLQRFGGQTPAEIDALITLPGVGRKTANLVRSFAFHLPAICVDTHVHRIANRWGLVRTVGPDETESALRRLLPPEYWIETNALLIQHGQQLCRPIGPKCAACPLRPWCRFPQLQAEHELHASLAADQNHPSLFQTMK